MLTRLRALAFAVTLMTAGVTAAHAEEDASTFHRDYATSTGQLHDLGSVALISIYNGIEWANAYLEANHRQKIYCPPTKIAIQVEQLADMLTRSVADKPSLGKQPFGLAVLDAVISDFPCPAN